jgi:hypothetical protein
MGHASVCRRVAEGITPTKDTAQFEVVRFLKPTKWFYVHASLKRRWLDNHINLPDDVCVDQRADEFVSSKYVFIKLIYEYKNYSICDLTRHLPMVWKLLFRIGLHRIPLTLKPPALSFCKNKQMILPDLTVKP